MQTEIENSSRAAWLLMDCKFIMMLLTVSSEEHHDEVKSLGVLWHIRLRSMDNKGREMF